MIKRTDFPIPEGVIEVSDEYQLNLAHYELRHLKPKGTILFAKEKREVSFQFFAGEDREEGIFARLDEPLSPNVTRITDYISKYPRTEAFITIVLLQFKFVFIATRVDMVRGPRERTYRVAFPTRFLKTHRRKYLRIPFNDTFPASLSFDTPGGRQTRKLKDLSREGMRLRLEEGDEKGLFAPGSRIKATLTLLNHQIKLGLSVTAVYPNHQAGLKIVAMSEEDQTWLKEFIGTLVKQILKLPDSSFDDDRDKDPVE